MTILGIGAVLGVMFVGAGAVHLGVKAWKKWRGK